MSVAGEDPTAPCFLAVQHYGLFHLSTGVGLLLLLHLWQDRRTAYMSKHLEMCGQLEIRIGSMVREEMGVCS